MEAVAANLSFSFVRFAPASREREPRVNLFSDEADEERLNRRGNDRDRRHDPTASASAAGTIERDGFSRKSVTKRDRRREKKRERRNDSHEGEREIERDSSVRETEPDRESERES